MKSALCLTVSLSFLATMFFLRWQDEKRLRKEYEYEYQIANLMLVSQNICTTAAGPFVVRGPESSGLPDVYVFGGRRFTGKVPVILSNQLPDGSYEVVNFTTGEKLMVWRPARCTE